MYKTSSRSLKGINENPQYTKYSALKIKLSWINKFSAYSWITRKFKQQRSGFMSL